MGVGEKMAPIWLALGQSHQATEAGQNLNFPRDKERTAHHIATKLGRYTPLPPQCFYSFLFIEDYFPSRNGIWYPVWGPSR